MDGMRMGCRLKNILSNEVRVTQTSRARSSCRAHRLCNLRVSMFVYLCLLMQFVSCLSSSLMLLFML